MINIILYRQEVGIFLSRNEPTNNVKVCKYRHSLCDEQIAKFRICILHLLKYSCGCCCKRMKDKIIILPLNTCEDAGQNYFIIHTYLDFIFHSIAFVHYVDVQVRHNQSWE